MMEEKEQSTIDRRSFLKAGALFGAGAAVLGLTGCGQPKSSAQAKTQNASSSNATEEIAIEATETVDIVVCGAGAAGLSAATKAAEMGKRVVLLEKSTEVGGASVGVYSATVHQADEDITDEVNAWVADSHWRVDAAIISNLLHKSGEAFTWLRDKHSWAFKETVSFGKPQWLIPGDATARIALYRDMLEKAGVDLRTGMTAKQLITDETGKITGVIATDASGKGTQYNCAAVSLATGGYAGNAQMVEEASGFGGVCGGLPQNIGEGLEMAWAAGGKKPINYGTQMLHQTLAPSLDYLSKKYEDLPAKYPFLTTYMPEFMNVTAKGRRFRNEGIIVSADAAANSSGFQGPFHYVVVSQQQIDQLAQSGLSGWNYTAKLSIPPEKAPTYSLDTPWSNASDVFKAMAEGEDGFCGNTFEELGEAAGMDGQAFAQACKNYESYCTTGLDTELGKESKYLRPMGTGPYYLVKAIQNNLTSWGGVATDIEYRVLNNEGDPIPGLYAIGVEAGSNLYNDTYVGVGIGVCLVYTSGYLAGQHMADYLTMA